jgi:hypothetical protein
VSLTHDDVVPHIIIQSSRLRLGEFETHAGLTAASVWMVMHPSR